MKTHELTIEVELVAADSAMGSSASLREISMELSVSIAEMASILELNGVAVIFSTGRWVDATEAVGLAVIVGETVRVGGGVDVADGSGVEVDVIEGLAVTVTVTDSPDSGVGVSGIEVGVGVAVANNESSGAIAGTDSARKPSSTSSTRKTGSPPMSHAGLHLAPSNRMR